MDDADAVTAQVFSHIESLAKATKSLCTTDIRALDKASEISKEVLRTSVFTLVAKAENRPMLRSSQSDGTPIRVKQTQTVELASGKKHHLSGKASHEFLVGNSMYKYQDEKHTWHTKVLFTDPQPLTEGKTAAALFEADKRYWLSLRQLGHQGFALEHYAWDRGCFSALSRQWKQWHSMMSTSWGVSNTLRSSAILWLLEWVITTACANHDINKAFEWAMWFDASSKELLSEVHISIESLRNSFDVIVKHVGLFIAKRIDFADPLPRAEVEQLRRLWLVLRVDEDTADMLSDVLELRWIAGRYVVSIQVQGVLAVSLVQTALLALWRWRKFTASRFLGIGHSCRPLTASLLTGADTLVETIINEDPNTLFYLKGFRRLTQEAREWVVKASLASRPMDAVQAILVKDGRVVKQLSELRGAIDKEMTQIENLEPFIWTQLAAVCGLEPVELRDSVLRVAHVSCGFFRYRVLDEAEGLPWSLASGDVARNLELLKNQPEPDEMNTYKIWCLLQIDWNRHELQSAVLLLLELCWWTLPAEQQHASLASLKRHHPDYGMSTLKSRATILQVNRVLPRTSPKEHALEKLEAKFERLKRKVPERAGAKQQYLTELFEAARNYRWTSKRPKPPMLHKTIFKSHTARWATAGPTKQQHFLDRAKICQAAKRDALATEQDKVKAEMARLREQIAKDSVCSKPTIMSSAQWGYQEMHLFSVLSKTSDFQDAAVAVRRMNIANAPRPTLPAMLQLLSAEDIRELPSAVQPGWVSQICSRRSSFNGTGLLVETGGETLGLKFLYASQQPTFICFSRITPCDEYFPHHDDIRAENLEAMCAKPPMKFTCDWSSLVRSGRLLDTDVANIVVLPYLFHAKGPELHCELEPIDLQQFLDSCPLDKQGRDPHTSLGGSRKTHTVLYTDCPAMQDYVARVRRKPILPTEAVLSSSEEEPPSDEEPLHEDDINAIFHDLALKRAELAANNPHVEDDFKVALSGGPSTMKRAGVAYDGIEASARGQHAKDFCHGHRLGLSFSCAFSRYDEGTAGILGRAWCHKMQWFYNKAILHENLRYIFTLAECQLYAEPTELTVLANTSTINSVVTRRVSQIRSLFL